VSPFPHLRRKTDPVPEALCFLIFRISDDGQSPKNIIILSLTHHRQILPMFSLSCTNQQAYPVVTFYTCTGIFRRWFPQCIHWNKKKIPWSESASELYRPSDRRLSTKLMPTFADRGCHMVSVTDPYGRILDFKTELLLNLYFFLKICDIVSMAF
jgi:hypothetical protein